MKTHLILLLLVVVPAGNALLSAQNVFRLEKEREPVVEMRSTPRSGVNSGLPGTVWDMPLDSLRMEISGNRRIYREWRRTREQARYRLNREQDRFVPDGESNGMYDWMAAYLSRISPGGMNIPTEWRLILPGFRWPEFEQEYYLADLVEARCEREKPGECVKGYVRMKVLVDAKGKVLEHEVLKAEDEFLAGVVAEEIYKIGFRPAEMVYDGTLPLRLYGFLDFEFAMRGCW